MHRHPVARPILFLALVLICCSCLAVPARAGDEPAEDSAAAQLFRDAWWAETGAGDLERARAGYERAVAAEGSEAIRARSLYRLAVVLERMGRAEEAVRTLERLAKDFPAQQELLEKARRHLDEWTAEDLRTSFSAWYRRYQYSAAFQAKIIDLVLKLGGADRKAAVAAEQELLTIGEPALNALRQHADTGSHELRSRVVVLMIRIGALPEPETLWKPSGWERQQGFWRLLFAADEAARRRYAAAAAAQPDDHRARWIEAALAGVPAVLDLAAEVRDDPRGFAHAVLYSALHEVDTPEAYRRLRALVSDAGADATVRAWAASHLVWRWQRARAADAEDPTGLTPQEIAGWLRLDGVREVALMSMQVAALPDPEVWRVAAEVALALPPQHALLDRVLAGMSGQLRRAAPEADVEPAVQAYQRRIDTARSTPQLGASALETGPELPGSGALPRAVLAAAIGRATGRFAGWAAGWWWQNLRAHEGALDVLFAWMRAARAADVRMQAAGLAAAEIEHGVDRLVAALDSPERRRELRQNLFNGLRGNDALVRLDWSVETLTRLVETAMAHEKYAPGRTYQWSVAKGGAGGSIRARTFVRSPLQAYDSEVLYRLLAEPRTRALLFDAAFRAPERFPPGFWALLGKDWRESPQDRDRALALLRERWQAWAPAQRGAGLRLFVDEAFLGRARPEVTEVLGEILQAGDLEPDVRLHLVQHMHLLTLADLKSIFDFDDPAQVDQATRFLRRVAGEEELYDAFRPALRPDGAAALVVYTRFQGKLPSRQQDLIRRLLAHERPAFQRKGIELLTQRDAVEDLPLWVELLGHARSSMRKHAATALGRMYDPASTKALARLVDDPHPEVRDAALASLQRIEETEKQKKRWREFAGAK